MLGRLRTTALDGHTAFDIWHQRSSKGFGPCQTLGLIDVLARSGCVTKAMPFHVWKAGIPGIVWHTATNAEEGELSVKIGLESLESDDQI